MVRKQKDEMALKKKTRDKRWKRKENERMNEMS